MIGYTASENAILSAFRTSFSDILNEDNAVSADIDKVIDSMFRKPYKYGLMVDFVNGQRRRPETFNSYIWQWNILITFLIRLDRNTIEEDVRTIIDRLSSFCEQNRTLSGQVAKFDMTYIDRASSGTVGDRPITWINISSYVWDK